MGKNNGFTLVELMLALAVSSVVMAGVYTAYSAQHKSYIAQDQTVIMQQNLRAGMYFMQKGIRMAGFDLNGTLGAAITAARSNSISFSRQYTEDFRDIDISGDQNGTEPFIDYNGNGTWDSGTLFTIQYSLVDSNADGVDDALQANIQGTNMRIAENIQALGFAYAFDKNPVDGQLDTAGGNTIWAIDTDGNGTLDLNLDNNGDGNINAADDTDGDGTINGVAVAGVDLDDIRAVKIWMLARAAREDKDIYNDMAYTVADRVITPNDGVRRELMTMEIRCRNLGL